MSLYQRLIDAGVPVDHHESDLYFPVTDATVAICKSAMANGELHSRPAVFKHQVSGRQWFDAAFMYTPFWEAKK
jgi:hypothetical protein